MASLISTFDFDVASAVFQPHPKTMETIGSYAPDFELPGVDGQVHHLARYLEQFRAVGVVVMCNHCPYVKLYLDRLTQIQADFQGQGFTLVGINPNDDQQFPEDSFEKMKSLAPGLNFPYLRDVTQDVARSFGAQKTPETFLISPEGIICYQGGVDDNPQNAAAVKQHYFRNAIAQLLSGQTIQQPSSAAIGCSVKWRV
ncbi:MAG: thioredoxin family protein [Oculatellaceae cyanobacterium Prado106]|jgi:peroxiredoxin|nr:thioredoxin family protein [Oculatellaceae cyanobacterium Prado106]